jgi:hypothetical protein
MQQVSHRGPTNTRRRGTKFSRHGDLATGICAPLIESIYRHKTSNASISSIAHISGYCVAV